MVLRIGIMYREMLWEENRSRVWGGISGVSRLGIGVRDSCVGGGTGVISSFVNWPMV